MNIENKSVLLVCPSVGIWEIGKQYYFDRKFYDGFLAYCTGWQGEVHLALRVETSKPPVFGLVYYEESKLPASLILLAPDMLISTNHMQGASIVLASGDDPRNFHISSLCRLMGIKCVYSIENTLMTRMQIAAISDARLFLRIKSSVRLLLAERKRRQAFRLSSGLQSNGVAAYNEYSKLSNNMLLYFDTRTSSALHIKDKELNERLAYLDENKPLRLGFSGRLIGIKGVEDLIDVSHELNLRKVPFTLEIFGEGDLKSLLQNKIEQYGLASRVFLRGAVDFSEELVPYIKRNVDLYIVCHPQSDPSCTYLETYACGIPIVGYSNKAHQGILKICDVGWPSPIGDIGNLANTIERLNIERQEIKMKSVNAMLFAREHTFEKTFEKRIEHIKQTMMGERGTL